MKILILLMLIFMNNSKASSNYELGLYFIPSPFGIDWSTPSSLAITALKNRVSLKSHFMGHVWVELTCGEYHDVTGMVGKNPDYATQLIMNQRGLGILFHSFEGRLEDKGDIIDERAQLMKEGRINFVKFKLNPGLCQRARTYLEEYRKNNVGRHYGLVNRPRHGEGAGCSAFGSSFVDVLKIIDQDMRESWSHTVKIPLHLAGPPVRDEGVGLLKVMLHSESWAKDQDPHRPLTFWDPDRMYSWVKEKISQNQSNYVIEKIQNAQGILIDKSHFPVPEEPIWQQVIERNI